LRDFNALFPLAARGRASKILRDNMDLHEERSQIVSAVRVGTALAWVGICLAANPSAVPAAMPGGGAVPVALVLGADESSDQGVDRVFLPRNRTAARRFERAERLFETGHYSDAVEFLDTILADPEDWFFGQASAASGVRSLKAEARRLIGQLPPRGRELYELRFGALAEKMLLESGGDLIAIARVARRFFYTRAGHEATWLLGYAHRDQGHALAAAICFQQLLDAPQAARSFGPALLVITASCWVQAGHLDDARRVLDRLRADYPHAQVQVGGRPESIVRTGTDPVAWLREIGGPAFDWPTPPPGTVWTMFRGNAARNAACTGGKPLLRPRWRVRTVNHPAVEEMVHQMQTAFWAQRAAALPGLHPLVLDEVVLMRTVQSVVAVDPRTGKRTWEWTDDATGGLADLVNAIHDAASRGRGSQLGLGLQYRLWSDAAYGNLTTDGRRLYLVGGLELASGVTRPRMVIAGGVHPLGWQGPKTTNRLVALDLHAHGQPAWMVGGAESDVVELADAFFLGPPLVLDDRLYVLAEIKSGVRLLVLEAASGRLQWSQQLADLELNIVQDPLRRMAGAAPSFADGVLVCPTSGGAVVAVDYVQRTLRWAFRYAQKFPQRSRILNLAMQQRARAATGGATGHWIDSSVTLADGCVLLTPVESDKIFCLRLSDGKLLWQGDRGEHLYLACVVDRRVVLVGRERITALRLADGTPAWSAERLLPAGSSPSGRGFLSGGQYFLPLTTGEVVTIDLADGRIVDRTKSQDGHAPGNLVCCGDQILSQGVDYLQAYYQLEPLKTRVEAVLARDPDNAGALARRAEIALEEGRRADAIDDLRRSFELEPSELTRQLLVQNMLDALRDDFVSNRDLLPALEQLVGQPELRAVYLWLVADGYQKMGLLEDAFQACLRLVDEPGPHQEMLSVEAGLKVRADRLIQARLTQLRAAATGAEAQRMDTAIQTRAAHLDPRASAGERQRFLAYFGQHPAAGRARRTMAEQLLAEQKYLECELHLHQLEQSAAPEDRRSATALMARLLVETEHVEQAAPYLRQLAGPLRDQVCIDGKTGSEVAATLVDGRPRPRGKARSWPAGPVTVSTSPEARKGTALRRRYSVWLRGPIEPFFGGMAVSVDQNYPQAVVGHDAYGVEKFRVPLSGSPRAAIQPRDYFANYRCNHAVAAGHLLLVSTGRQVIAVDTLRPESAQWDRVPWRYDVVEPMSLASPARTVRPRRVERVGQLPRYEPVDAHGRPVGVLGPVLSHGVLLRRADQVVCLDPATGQTLWVREGVAAGSTLFGDDQRLFVVPPAQGTGLVEALVLRAFDGTALGTRLVAPDRGADRGATRRMANVGGRVLQWSKRAGGLELALVDPWRQQEIWQRSFGAAAKPWLLQDRWIGVLEPSGRFVLMEIATGTALVDAMLEPEPELAGIYLLAGPERIFLVASVPGGLKDKTRRISSIPTGYENPLITGRIYAFDRTTGKPAWPVPARVAQRSLPLEQPPGLPVLVFIQQVTQRETDANRRAHTKVTTSLLCLDKRTGKPVCDQRQLKPTGGSFAVVGQPNAGTVRFALASATVTLTYRPGPAPPEPPWQGDLEGRPQAESKGLIDRSDSAAEELRKRNE